MIGNIGKKLYGYCGGYFGRESYGTKTILCEGLDWLLVAEDGARWPQLAKFDSVLEKSQAIEEYEKEPKDDDEDW